MNFIRKPWQYNARPLPKNVRYIPYYEPGKYDLAILHIDQQAIDPMIGKGKLYRHLNEAIKDIPKIVINHGTPDWPERWESAGSWCWKMPLEVEKAGSKAIKVYQRDFLIEGGQTIQKDELVEIEGLKKLIGNNTMVVNSFEAAKQWGFGIPIWHGINPDDWFYKLPKEPRSVIVMGPAGLDHYYGRFLLNDTKSKLRDNYGLRLIQIGEPHEWTIQKHRRFSSGEWDGFRAYRDYLGRSLIYVNLTQESPMPRGRTEAMLSGLCTLTTPFQDADKFINCDTRLIWKNVEGIGEYIKVIDELIITQKDINGFIIPNNPLPIAALVNHLIYKRYNEAVRIGLNGRKTAKKLFNPDRYNSEWTDLLNRVIKEFHDQRSKTDKSPVKTA